ncbi:MAG: queuosine precursor transporter [Gammaproteobacteria bacterium]|jgi:uncharacterized integral membrane protein (TIGR00697 family)|nr:queuosine precursor transporter [Gammaproteobacteria bacterium]
MTSLFAQPHLNTFAKRQESVFIVLAGIFLSTLAVLNVIGLSRILDLSFSLGSLTVPVTIPLGVLPYPLTFLCTDLIVEFYGKQRAKLVIWTGLFINLWIFFIMWGAGFLPPHVELDPITHLPETTHPHFAFFQIRMFTFCSMAGSVIAYLVAQLIDVQIFQLCKKLTHGKHLWFRSNVSTLFSQFVDTILVISIAFLLTDSLIIHNDKSAVSQLINIVLSCYLFKMLATIVSTIPFYIVVFSLRKYFGLSNKSDSPKQTLEPFSASA